jgi:hypothetical protein
MEVRRSAVRFVRGTDADRDLGQPGPTAAPQSRNNVFVRPLQVGNLQVGNSVIADTQAQDLAVDRDRPPPLLAAAV